MKLGEYLKDLRAKRNLTLRDVQEMSGVSNAYVSQIENGARQRPHPDILKKLAAALEVEMETLLKLAGYVEDKVYTAAEEEINRAFRQVVADRRYVFGTRLEKELDIDAKRTIIQMYEDATGLKLLSEKEADVEAEDEDVRVL